MKQVKRILSNQLLIGIGCVLLSFNIHSKSYSPHYSPKYRAEQKHLVEQKHPWSFIAGLGYTEYENVASSDSQTVLERLGFAKELARFNLFSLGGELAVQTGNRMDLEIPQSAQLILGDLPIETTVKEMIDLLATVKTQMFGTTPFFLIAKGGAVYRQLKIDRDSVNNKSQFSAEAQGGVGLQIDSSAYLSVLYQGFFNGETNFLADPLTTTGYIAHIPAQNSVLLVLTVNV